MSPACNSNSTLSLPAHTPEYHIHASYSLHFVCACLQTFVSEIHNISKHLIEGHDDLDIVLGVVFDGKIDSINDLRS